MSRIQASSSYKQLLGRACRKEVGGGEGRMEALGTTSPTGSRALLPRPTLRMALSSPAWEVSGTKDPSGGWQTSASSASWSLNNAFNLAGPQKPCPLDRHNKSMSPIPTGVS